MWLMRLLIATIILIFFTVSSFIDTADAFEFSDTTNTSDTPDATKSAPASIELSEELIIDQRLIVLMQLSENSPDAIKNQLKPIQADRESFNAAEQYLLLLLEAIVASTTKEYDQVVELVKRAHKFEEGIAKKQLNEPVFAQSYLLLADTYVALKDFENAYLAKKSYFDYYQHFSWDEYDKKVELINEKHKTKLKLDNNELLLSQNKLKQLALKDAVDKNKDQQINTLLIIALTVVFLLIFFRQLKVRKQLVLLSKTDSLTGLANRRSLFEQGKKLIAALPKAEPQLSVLVVDVDYFKKVNDQYGHDIGDKVLKKIAVFGNEVMRSRDVFARLGGEEFVAVLPDAKLEEAKAIAERLKEKVVEFDFSYFGIKESLSISIGISTLSQSLVEFEDLLHAADLAMYHAKSCGRDQVVIYQTSMNSSENRVVRTSK